MNDTENLVKYATCEVYDEEDGDTGYLAIGFVDSRDDNPPMRPRTIEGRSALAEKNILYKGEK